MLGNHCVNYTLHSSLHTSSRERTGVFSRLYGQVAEGDLFNVYNLQFVSRVLPVNFFLLVLHLTNGVFPLEELFLGQPG